MLSNFFTGLLGRFRRSGDGGISLMSNSVFVQSWLGSATELTPERERRIKAATDAALLIANVVNLQMGLAGLEKPRTWRQHRPSIFGYVTALASLMARGQGESSAEHSLFVCMSALSLLHGRGVDDAKLFSDCERYKAENNAHFLGGAAAANEDYQAIREQRMVSGLLSIVHAPSEG